MKIVNKPWGYEKEVLMTDLSSFMRKSLDLETAIHKHNIIKGVAIDWVCPLNHNPTTPYEKGEVNRLIRFAEDVILALGENENSK